MKKIRYLSKTLSLLSAPYPLSPFNFSTISSLPRSPEHFALIFLSFFIPPPFLYSLLLSLPLFFPPSPWLSIQNPCP